MSFFMNPDSATRIATQQLKEAHAARQQDRLAGLVPTHGPSVLRSSVRSLAAAIAARVPSVRSLTAAW